MSVSSVAYKGSSSSSSSSDSKRIEFEVCAKQIQELVKKLKLGVLNYSHVNLQRFICPITQDVPQDPVMTNCGHIFERSALASAFANANSRVCPDCRAEVIMESSCFALKNAIQAWQQEEPIASLSHFKKENNQLAEFYFGIANQCIKAEQYQMALTSLSQAFLYTKKSENYAMLPPVYEKLNDPEKANLAYLHLAMYQLEEGKVAEATKSLERCKELSPELQIDLILLALDPTPTRIAKAMQNAPKQEREEAIAIYKQIIAYSPRVLSAFEALIPLLKNREEKKHYLLKAAECATKVGETEKAEELRKQAEMPTSITLEEWANPQLLLDRITLPKKLEDFLAAPCPIWEGKTARETHGFALRFKNVIMTENGSLVEVPRTLAGLDRCDKASGGPGFNRIKPEALDLDIEEEEYEWIVLTKDVLPGSREEDYAVQKELVESKGYEVPSVIDAATYILWENRLSGNRLFSDEPLTHTRCRESVDGYPLAVGRFTLNGLDVDDFYCYDFECLGMAGLRKF